MSLSTKIIDISGNKTASSNVIFICMCGNKTWNPTNMYKSYNYVFEQRVKSILEVTNCCLGDVSVVVSDCFQSSNI